MSAELSGAIASTATLIEIGKTFFAARDSHKAAAIEIDFMEKLIKLQDQLIEANNASLERTVAMHSMTERLRRPCKTSTTRMNAGV